MADFQARVPLRRYEDFWDDYWSGAFPILENCTWPGKIRYFALTSGTTTGETKHIPVTAEMLRANSHAIQDLLSIHLVARPLSRVMQGKGLLLGGSTDLKATGTGRLIAVTSVGSKPMKSLGGRPPMCFRIANWRTWSTGTKK